MPSKNPTGSSSALEKTKTPGVYKRGNRFVVVWRHRGKQHKSFHPTYEQAREAKRQRSGEGDRRPIEKVRLEDYFSEWIESYAGRTARGFSETTRPEYRRPIEAHALPAWGRMRLAEIETADVRELFGSMRKDGCSTASIKKLRAALSAMFATAVDDGKMRSNPAAGVRIPAALEQVPTEEKAKALTRADLAILIDELPEDWRLFFEFLAHTGVRISEAVGLRWKHLDLGVSPRVKVREQLYEGVRKPLKSAASSRDVPLSPGMTERLLAHRRDAEDASENAPVFASSTGTELRPANVYRRVLSPAAIAVGLAVEVEVNGKTRKRSAVSFHTFRHTCASMLFERGRNPKQVAGWLGHTDPGFTLRTYVHLMDNGVGDADFLDEVVAPQPEAALAA